MGVTFRHISGHRQVGIVFSRSPEHNSASGVPFPMREGARDAERRGRMGVRRTKDKRLKMKDERVGEMVERLNG